MVFVINLYARASSNTRVFASATIAIAVSILGFVIAPVLADISEEYLEYRMPYDLMINNSYRYIDELSDIPKIDFSFVDEILLKQGIDEAEYKSDKDYQDFIEPIRLITQEINAVKINSACMRLLGVYIGVIFFVICSTVLALQQLSDAENSKRQYGIMFKLGIEKRDIYQLIKKQIAMFFAIPCVLAICGAGVGIYVFMLRFGHKIETYVGTTDFILNIIIAIIMMMIIFAAYFVGTIKAYQHSISSTFETNSRKQI